MIDYHTFILKNYTVASLLYVLSLQVPTHMRRHCFQEMVHLGAIILHMANVFIDPTPGVPFRISIPPMVRAAIIEYAPGVHVVMVSGRYREDAFGHFGNTEFLVQ